MRQCVGLRHRPKVLIDYRAIEIYEISGQSALINMVTACTQKVQNLAQIFLQMYTKPISIAFDSLQYQ